MGAVRVAAPSAAGSICYYYHSPSAWAVIIVTSVCCSASKQLFKAHQGREKCRDNFLSFPDRGERECPAFAAEISI